MDFHIYRNPESTRMENKDVRVAENEAGTFEVFATLNGVLVGEVTVYDDLTEAQEVAKRKAGVE